MKTSDILAFSEQLTRLDVLLAFNGPFSHAIIQEVGAALRSYMKANQVDTTAIRDVFSTYVEQAQNIRRYCARTFPGDTDRHRGIVMIERVGDHYAVCAGNYVLTSDVPALRARIEQVRGADKPALKAMFKTQLHAETPPDAEGAELGFISMARAASAPLEYSFEPVDGVLTRFALRVLI
jgi:hypothetical protein